MAVLRSPLSSPVKCSDSLEIPETQSSLIKEPSLDVEAQLASSPIKVKTVGYRRVWRTFALLVGILLTSLILINGFVIVLGLIDLL